MDAEATKPLPAFGFLSVFESEPHGLFGGYLVLSPWGRPLEFRCSTPVVPSRAQQILYGPTLRPYLMAEVIGAALLSDAQRPVQAILVDDPDLLALELVRAEPIVWVGSRASADHSCTKTALTGAGLDSAAAPSIESCRYPIVVRGITHTEQLAELLKPLAAHVDLAEPFARIRGAIAEAQGEWRDDGAASAGVESAA